MKSKGFNAQSKTVHACPGRQRRALAHLQVRICEMCPAPYQRVCVNTGNVEGYGADVVTANMPADIYAQADEQENTFN